jgi:hypothetical protein
MDVTLECKLTLSKKLRQHLKGADAKVFLVSEELKAGKGMARLTLSSEDDMALSDEMIEGLGETSIMLIPIQAADPTPSEQMGVSSIFSADMESRRPAERDAVDRLAATEAPTKQEVAHAIVAEEEMVTPQEFVELDDPECRKWISNMGELMMAVIKAKNRPQQEVDLSSAKDERERLILLEAAERQGGLESPAWIVNDKTGMITINDMEVDLPLNSPFNLMGISPSKIAASQDLKVLVKQELVKFISPNEVGSYFEQADEADDGIVELEVFDNAEQAAEHMATTAGDVGERIEVFDSSQKTDEESMILDLTAGMPRNKSEKARQTRESASESGTAIHRKTSHGQRSSGGSSTPQEHRTVRRTG